MRSAGFQTCCVADFLIGTPSKSSAFPDRARLSAVLSTMASLAKVEGLPPSEGFAKEGAKADHLRFPRGHNYALCTHHSKDSSDTSNASAVTHW